MIFNPSIKSIILENVNENEKLIFSRSEKNDGIVKIVEIISEKTFESNERSFIYSEASCNFQYELISKDVNINCMVEIGNNNIVYNEEFLYLSFPMLGFKPFD